MMKLRGKDILRITQGHMNPVESTSESFQQRPLLRL